MNPPVNKVRSRTVKSGGNGSVTTTRRVTGAEEVSQTRNFQDQVNCPNPAYVGVNQNLTKNMGDYNSIKIGVHVSIPCLPDDDSIRDAYDRATELVGEFLDAEYDAAIADHLDED